MVWFGGFGMGGLDWRSGLGSGLAIWIGGLNWGFRLQSSIDFGHIFMGF